MTINNRKTGYFVVGSTYGTALLLKSLLRSSDGSGDSHSTPFPLRFLCSCGKEFWSNEGKAKRKIQKGTLTCGHDLPPVASLTLLDKTNQEYRFFFGLKGEEIEKLSREEREAIPIIFHWFLRESGLSKNYLWEHRKDLKELCLFFAKDYKAFICLMHAAREIQMTRKLKEQEK